MIEPQELDDKDGKEENGRGKQGKRISERISYLKTIMILTSHARQCSHYRDLKFHSQNPADVSMEPGKSY